MIAKAAIQAADAEALVNLGNWCSYDTVRERYATGKADAISMADRCVALREYLAEQAKDARPDG